MFILDKNELLNFNKAVEYMMNVDKMPPNQKISNHVSMPHHIGQYYYINNIPFHMMYNEHYKTICNPIYTFCRYQDIYK
jgi:hypothetical protein